MSKIEILKYKWDNDLNVSNDCSDCSDCYDCSDCSRCSDCSNCYGCRNLRKVERYMICNIQFTKEEYEKKIKEINL